MRIHSRVSPWCSRIPHTDACAFRVHSRRSTNLLASAVCALEKPPKVLIAASGVGYYGSDLTTDDVITESAPQGGGFLADVSDVFLGPTPCVL
jgi:NAD dependent epimerase/dehydratase family enzyme